jgi:hypothetical protein
MPERSLVAAAAAVRQHVIVRLEPILEPALRCPWCGAPHFDDEIEFGRRTIRCERERCRCRWWAMVLEEGPVEPQLRWAFEDLAIAASLMEMYQLPIELPRPMYWQLPLRSDQHHRHFKGGQRTKPVALFRALGLLVRKIA